jgi:hypothetical protein
MMAQEKAALFLEHSRKGNGSSNGKETATSLTYNQMEGEGRVFLGYDLTPEEHFPYFPDYSTICGRHLPTGLLRSVIFILLTRDWQKKALIVTSTRNGKKAFPIFNL